MFRIDYNDRYSSKEKSIYTDDIKDVGQILINIVNDESAENEAMQWCSKAHWGDNFINQKYRFKIQCVYNEKHILPSRINNTNFNDIKFLQKIANEITQRSRIKNSFIGEDNDSLTWDFDYGISYMKNNCGNGLYFAINDKTGKEIWTISTTNINLFITKVSDNLLRVKSKDSIDRKDYSIHNKDILNAIRQASEKHLEYHNTIFSKGCWKLDIELHPYGNIRFWVTREDKLGNYQSSLCTPYVYNGNIKYSSEIKLIKEVERKLINTYKVLYKAGYII